MSATSRLLLLCLALSACSDDDPGSVTRDPFQADAGAKPSDGNKDAGSKQDAGKSDGGAADGGKAGRLQRPALPRPPGSGLPDELRPPR